MRLVMVAVIGLLVAGCATNRQKFEDYTDQSDRTYEIVQQPDGTFEALMLTENLLTRTINGRNLTNAPPFGSEAVADSHLDMTDNENWSIQMGQISELMGGDVTPIFEAAVEAGLILGTGGAAALPLTIGDNE